MGDAHSRVVENTNIFHGNVLTAEDYSVEIIACLSTTTAPALKPTEREKYGIEF